MITNDKEVLKKWEDDYSKLYQPAEISDFDDSFKERKMFELDDMLQWDGSIELNKPITYQEVKRAVDSSKLKKAVGFDLVPNELLKNDQVIDLLFVLFTMCFRTKLIPDAWQKAIITPIPKMSGYVKDPLKYRGLALQSCIYKIFSVIINSRVSAYLEKSKILVDEQNGFQKGRSCLHHIFTLQTLIRNKTKTRHGSVFASFIDYRRAFDVIDRNLLRYKLRKNGICGAIMELIDQMYRDTVNMIKVNNILTEEICSETGVMQGHNLSPTCFSVYINDLLTDLRNTNIGIDIGDGNGKTCVLAYADDIVLISDNATNLQLLLDKVYEWCRKYRVLINYDKSKTMHFHKRKTQLSYHKFHMGPNEIGNVSSYRYLGVCMSEYLSSDEVVTQLASAASRALGQVINKTKDKFDLGYSSYTKLFVSCVCPIMDYGSTVWNMNANTDKLDKVQARAARYYLGVPRTSATQGINGLIGWTPGVVRRDLECLRLYNQIVKMDHDRLTKRVFKHDAQTDGLWSRNVCDICSAIGELDNYRNDLVINLGYARKELLQQYADVWADEVGKKPKLETMSKVHNQLSAPSYIRANIPKVGCSLISQLLCGSLPLEIEGGRYLGIICEERMCKLCNTAVEDDMHFLFGCPKLINEQISLYVNKPELLNSNDMSERLKFLLNMPFLLSKYIRNNWQTRNEILSKVNK